MLLFLNSEIIAKFSVYILFLLILFLKFQLKFVDNFITRVYVSEEITVLLKRLIRILYGVRLLLKYFSKANCKYITEYCFRK